MQRVSKRESGCDVNGRSKVLIDVQGGQRLFVDLLGAAL